MSDVAIGRAGSGERGSFRVGVVIGLFAIGIFGFAALVVGSAYTPERGISQWVSGHALSDSAVGYSGVIRLARETGHKVAIISNKGNYLGEDLFVDSLLVFDQTDSGPALPRTLDAALTALHGSTVARRLLGDEFVNAFVAVKELELDSFLNEITPWERRYLAALI